MNKFEEFKAKGNNCFKQGQYNEAVECYKEAIKQDPTNPVGYSNCAMALIKLDNFDSASQMCKRGLFYVNDTNDANKKIAEKLKWRLDVCTENTKDGLIPVEIYEVDKLPEQYRNL